MSKRRHRGPVLSVIIVNYNVRDFLHHALTSLQKGLRGIRHEIFVVDNKSDDGSVEMLRRSFPAVKVIHNAENVGFARGNNQALESARGKYILLINPDTVVQEDTISTMVRFFEENADVGLAGCKVLNPDGTFQLACRRSFPTPWVAFTKITGLARLFPRSRLFGKYNLTYLSPDESYDLDAVSGSFMMLRKQVYDKVGGLDESFFMYGEDLDWCYRIQRSGWKIYYVHSTKIIHFKGESTRRSDIDEIKMFYEAMHLFVRKHVRRSFFFSITLRTAITVVSWLAAVKEFLRPLAYAILDVALIVGGLMVAEILWLGRLFYYPAYAYPLVYTIPPLILVASLYSAGVYTHRRMSLSRTVLGVAAGYVVISALVAFFRDYAFSRMVILLSGVISLLTLPGWRLMFRLAGRSAVEGRKTLFGRKTLVVGTEKDAQVLLKKIRTGAGGRYSVVGIIDTTRRRIGKLLDGVPIVGSLENVGKVIHELRISDVIFSTEKLSYRDILSVISRTGSRAVNFHLVPDTLEVIIGKASVDPLEEVPLVQISYNIERQWNRFVKRSSDLIIGAVLLISIYPFVYWKSATRDTLRLRVIRGVPSVIAGRRSLVGPPEVTRPQPAPKNLSHDMLYLGKPGLTGLVQLQGDRPLTETDIEQYNLYYARNQSFLLDLEILLKTALTRRR